MSTDGIKEDSLRLLNRIDTLFDSNLSVPANELVQLIELRKHLVAYHESIK